MKPMRLFTTAAALAVLALAAGRAGELIEQKESWSRGTTRGWSNLTGTLDVRWTPEVTDRGGLAGRFERQGVAFPEVDSFVAGLSASGGMLAGDYTTNGATPVRLAFDFLAADVLPSALWFQLIGIYGGNTNSFMLSLTNQLPAGGGWCRLEVPLHYESVGWIGGGTGEDFTNALRNVQELNLRLVRQGTEEQEYLMDNFSLVKDIPSATATNDTDGDGLPDYWELAHFGNPTNAAPGADSDGDRMPNRAEFIAGTDPWDSASALWIDGLEWTGQQGHILFNSALGRHYEGERADSVLTQSWNGVSGAVTGSGGYASLAVSNAALLQHFRLKVTKP